MHYRVRYSLDFDPKIHSGKVRVCRSFGALLGNLPKHKWKFYNPTCLNDDAVELAEAEIHAEDEKRFVIG
jgi:hypothetical protein